MIVAAALLVVLQESAALAVVPQRRRSTRLGASTDYSFAPRELGAMECLFAPRRSLDTCALPTTVHVCAAILEGTLSDEALFEGLVRAIRRNALLRARLVGDGRPARRGPLGAPLEDAGVLKNVLAPFGDDNMRIGPSQNPLRFEPMDASVEAVAAAALEPSVRVADDSSLETAWRDGFRAALDADGGDNLFGGAAEQHHQRRFEFSLDVGPLWRCKAYRSRSRTVVALGFNHAISDQPSAMSLFKTILDDDDFDFDFDDEEAREFPPSLEKAILGDAVSRGFVSEETGGAGLLALDKGSFPYLASKASEKCVDPLAASACSASAVDRARDPSLAASRRRSRLVFRDFPERDLENLRLAARAENTTVGSALAAAAAIAFAATTPPKPATRDTSSSSVKVLQSLDMRRFGTWSRRDALACHAGSFDVLLDPKGTNFWDLARSASGQLASFVDRDFGAQSVRVFDWASDAMEMARLVELEADNPLTLGRAYACGVSNAGVFEKEEEEEASFSKIDRIYYATSNAYSGSLFQAYVVTVDGALNCCFLASEPLVSPEALDTFADVFLRTLRTRAPIEPQVDAAVSTNAWLAASAGAVFAAALRAPAWAAFFDALVRAAEASSSAGDLVAPFGFWLFFALMHPLVGAAGVGLGELVWRFPGYGDPANLDASGPPILFALVFAAATNIALASRAIRAALAAAAAFWLVDYVGAGLAGTTPDVASYDLALDDDKVRGCPTYAEVATPSMRTFDVTKYAGRWYEHAYHDWTQFSQVYDTSLDINIARDGATWYDAFSVKGPSPKAAPRSWRGSPVANAALYPLYGALDPATPGRLVEKGFGNVFPNFIVDVKRDPATGDYTEAIQFQCLEAGGVRVFEGINFLSREPKIDRADLDAMFQRAATIAPYGATRDQMHLVDHAPDFVPISNWWQSAWAAIGFDKLLALIAADL